jgi:hypothetical protein
MTVIPETSRVHQIKFVRFITSVSLWPEVNNLNQSVRSTINLLLVIDIVRILGKTPLGIGKLQLNSHVRKN